MKNVLSATQIRRFLFTVLSAILFLSACAQTPEEIRKAKLARQRQNYSVSHSSGDMQFVRVRTRGDGDCALHGIERSRSEFTTLLTQRISEPRIQNMLRGDLRDAGMQPRPGNRDFDTADYQIYIQQRLTQRSEHLSFIPQASLEGVTHPDLTTPSPDSEVEGTLAAAAYIFDLNVRVWRHEPNTPATSIRLIAKLINNRNSSYIDLLYMMGAQYGHFDRLVDPSDTNAMSRAVDREP